MVETVSKIKNEVLAVVVDPHCFIALPDPDPAFYLNADPDTRSRSMRIMILVRQKVEFLYEKYS